MRLKPPITLKKNLYFDIKLKMVKNGLIWPKQAGKTHYFPLNS